MTIKEMIQLMEAVNKYNIDCFRFESETEKITLRKNVPPTVLAPAVSPAGTSPVPVPSGASLPTLPAGGAEGAETAGTLESDRVILSPLVGTYYQAPTPDSPPFVQEGDMVKKGQVIAIVEAMKLMNEIESEYDGVVEAILVEDGSLVEYGQPMFRIR